MGKQTTSESFIGKRIGTLYRRMDIRIAFATGYSDLYREEAKRYSAMSQTQKAANARLASEIWKAYATNVTDMKNELRAEVRKALLGYTEQEKTVFWMFFIESKTYEEIEASPEINMSLRTIYRLIKAMRDELDMRFVPEKYERGASIPNWSSSDLALFLEEKPSEDYLRAIKDCLEYGIIDIDAIETDPEFQYFLEQGKHSLKGGGENE